MSGKTSILKILFVVSILGVLGLVAIAPSVAKAFFPQGVSGFASRILSRQSEQPLAPGLVPTQVDSNLVVGSAISAVEDSAVGVAASSELDTSAVQVDYFEFIGTVEVIQENTWTVEGVTVHVTPTTELKGTLDVGTLVKVEGALQDDGTVMARQIKPAMFDDSGDNTGDNGDVDNSAGTQAVDGNKIEFTGTLDVLGDTAWVVSEITVYISDTTEVHGSPAQGDLVKVEGELQDDGTVMAREIKPALGDDGGMDNDGEHKDDGDDHQAAGMKTEFTGVLTAKDVTAEGGMLWTVGGVQVMVTEKTELKGTLEIGSMVKVEGYLLDDGSVEAHEIQSKDSNNHDDDRSGIQSSSSDDDDDHNSQSGSSYSSDDDHGDDDDHDDDHGDSHNDDDKDHDDDDDDDRDGHGYFIDQSKSLS